MSNYSKIIKLVLPVLIFSCSSNSNKKNIVLKELITTLEASNRMLEKSTEIIHYSIEDRTLDFAYSEKAKVWEPRAKAVSKISKKAYDYIDILKEEVKQRGTVNTIFHENKKGDELFNRLNTYRQDLMAVDSGIQKEFKEKVIVTTSDFDSGKIQNNFRDFYFKNISVNEALGLLAKFQNNIKVNENRIITFCHEQTSGIRDDFPTYSAIVGQSSNIVKAGDKIKISTGVGAFSKAALPKILINEKKVDINEHGVAILEFKASSKPGKHLVPVMINYIDEDGKKVIIEQKVEYTVSNCGN